MKVRIITGVLALLMAMPIFGAADNGWNAKGEAFKAVIDFGDWQKLDALIRKYNFDVNESENENSMLSTAVMYGNPKVVEGLLNRNAYIQEGMLSDASHEYLGSGSEDYLQIVRLLLRYGADPKEENDHGDPLDLAIERLGDYNSQRTGVLLDLFKEYSGLSMKPAKG